MLFSKGLYVFFLMVLYSRWTYSLDKIHSVIVQGYVTFIAGNFLQFQSHYILSQLGRRTRSRKYSIPRGGLFQYVSCPHYFAEILIYLGMSVSFYPFNNLKSLYPLILVVRLVYRWIPMHYSKMLPSNLCANA